MRTPNLHVGKVSGVAGVDLIEYQPSAVVTFLRFIAQAVLAIKP